MAATILAIVMSLIMTVIGVVGFSLNISGLSINDVLEEWRNQEERNK